MIGFVSRSTKEFKSPASLLHLYKTLVRSLLEYCTVIWSPFYNKHVERIERVQIKLLKIICYRYGLSRKYVSYGDKLREFQLISLESRRKYFDLMYLYKIVNSYVDSPFLLSLLNFNIRFKSRNPKLFILQVYTNNTSFYNPIVRMCRTYNDVALKYPCLDIYHLKLQQFRRLVLDNVR